MPSLTADAAVGTAPARAALAGNPSDGYGGAVLAVTVDALGATVRLGDGQASRDELTAAARRRLEREFGLRRRPEHRITLETTIPESVGLAGSSAIVIATLRALGRLHHVSLDPVTLAELALSIEVDDLGITAGLQDRLVQAHGGLLFMEFSGPRPRAERLDPAALPPLLIGWRAAAGQPSGVVHAGLRERWEGGDARVREAMGQLGGLARRARAALLAGAPVGFRSAVDGTYDIRTELLDLDPAHVAMVQAGRSAGAAVNYTGSGGAVVCVCDDQGHREAVALALREVGAETCRVG